jgi:hypothetical protein
MADIDERFDHAGLRPEIEEDAQLQGDLRRFDRPRRGAPLSPAARQLATTWTRDQLEARYRDAERRGAESHEETAGARSGALSLIAAAIPPSATTSVAIHILHALPQSAPGEPRQQLLTTASRNTASALRRCHVALERDGAAHGYRAEEWLPVITDIASRLLQSARLDEDPPTIVEQAQQAIAWMSRAVVELHDHSTDTPTSLSEALACLLVVWVFTELARKPTDSA